jgi:hypothetical protein
MSGSRRSRRRKRAASAQRDGGKPATSRRVAPIAAVAVVARETRDADPAALRAEIRALKRTLAVAEEKANDADAKRSRAVSRATASLRRENESLEAHLTLLVQEIGQIKHVVDRVPRLEADLRSRELLLAERSQAWQSERTSLLAEIDRLRGVAHAGAPGARAKLAAAAAPGSRMHGERAR